MREYLYMDTGVVRSILAQLEDGLVESTTAIDREATAREAGAKGFLSGETSRGHEASRMRSMAETHFPSLEEVLESQSLLADVSAKVQNASWEEIRRRFPPGSIIRLTAPGIIADSRYLAKAFADVYTVAAGIDEMRAGPASNNKRKPQPKKESHVAKSHPEELIPTGPLPMFGAGLTGGMLRGIIRAARGIFPEGIHLHLHSDSSDEGAVSVRLQDGYEYLNADPSVIFSRYGVTPQEWTVVGTIGHFGTASDDDAPATPDIGTNVGINRRKYAELISVFTQQMGDAGLIDLPQPPGFSVVPWAVYRILNPAMYADNLT